MRSYSPLLSDRFLWAPSNHWVGGRHEDQPSCTHVWTQTGMHTCMHNSYSHMHNYIYTHIHVYAHVCSHAITHTHVHTHVHTYMYTGWLKRQLELQAEGLSGHLPRFWADVMNSSWVGGTADFGLHERAPYWLNGFVPLAYQLQDPLLISYVCKIALLYLLLHSLRPSPPSLPPFLLQRFTSMLTMLSCIRVLVAGWVQMTSPMATATGLNFPCFWLWYRYALWHVLLFSRAVWYARQARISSNPLSCIYTCANVHEHEPMLRHLL